MQLLDLHLFDSTVSLNLKSTLATHPAWFTSLCFLFCFMVEPYPTANSSRHGFYLLAFAQATPAVWLIPPFLHLTLPTLSLEHQSNFVSSSKPFSTHGAL